MRHHFTSALLLSATLLITSASCMRPTVYGKGEEKSEQRSVSGNFTQVKIGAPVDAEIRIVPGAAPSISMSGYANVLSHVKIKVEDGTLKIFTEKGVRIHTRKNLAAIITLPALTGLELAGSSDAKVTGNVTGNEFKVDLAGSGSINIASLNVSLLDVDMAGASDITIQEGNVADASYDIAGSGDVHAMNLQTTNTELEVAGSGSAEINVASKLDVSIAGSGSVRYKGNPAISKDIAGSGSIEQVL